ncbi:MAG: GAF domain-containing protein [Candidatus Thiodiazotropha sp.]
MAYFAPQVSEKQLLSAVTSVLSQYITETNPHILFNGLLGTLLEITASEYGFIGEVFYDDGKLPYIKSYATTNIAWDEETQALYEETRRKGMIFSRLDSLYGAVLKTGQRVISNKPMTDPRACGLPEGHPPLNAFMGLPFYGGGELLGVVGIANREAGYQDALAESLQPFLITCGNLILGYRSNVKHLQTELELNRYKERLSLLEQGIALGSGYEFQQSPPTLMRAGQSILLTKKELSLLSNLVGTINRPIPYAILEQKIWTGVVVGESSLRSLVRRLRKKVPELTIQNAVGVGYMLVVED